MQQNAGRLPDFLVIGAMKAGTSSLYRYLAAHPGVFMPTTKELNFFVDEYRGPISLNPPEATNWRRGLDWYRAWFADADPAQRAGEASPKYTKAPEYPGAAERIAQLLPNARLVYAVRDPIDRIRSHYLHDVAVGRERAPIAEAVRRDPRYLSTSRYAAQLREYLDRFSREALLVITADELLNDRRATVARVLGHIGADPARVPDAIDEVAHQSAGKRRQSPVAGALGRLPGRRLAPRGLRDAVRRVVTRPIDLGGAAIDARLRDWLVGELEDDLLALRTLLGERIDAWPSVAALAARSAQRG